ncbi:MAG: hypothetical protein VXV96_18740 [Bdellovibrionota bacterium]|jgi:hypothetical protein|nr:hypothetical protein [Bdellovibrionota bacterium]
MDRKQRKEKKRAEKIKQKKLHDQRKADEGYSETEKKSGMVQLAVFFGVALAGALIYILNV